MSSKPMDSVGVAVTLIGGVLVYAGARGYSVLAVVQNLVAGKPITTGVSVSNPLSTGNADVQSTVQDPTAPSGTPKAIGQQLAAQAGWTGAEWSALETLWDHESNWNPTARNPSSGAYGIPQALPYTKMPKAAWPNGVGGRADAATQIKWGIGYIKGRYGKPSSAWAIWQRRSPHWY
jgi:hypothetical protein